MVIGNGLLATRFGSYKDNDRYLVFAAGVSNSKSKDPEDYAREIEFLQNCLDKHPDLIFVYFSTCSVYDPEEQNSVYVKHKLAVEKLIESKQASYIIFRVSNVVAHSRNPNTLLNYFVYHIKNRINFDLWVNACRNIIDLDDVFTIADLILQENKQVNRVINIANPLNQKVTAIVREVESHLQMRSSYIEVNKGSCYEADISAIAGLLDKCPGKFDEHYLSHLLKKYY